MRYISTRGDAPPIGFSEAVLAGLAPDGGLYVPEVWPQVGPDEIAGFAGRPYADVAADIIGRFTGGEIEADLLAEMCAEAYASFTHPAVTPLKELYPGQWLLELFHGPTLAFKDVAMQILARLYDHILGRQGRTLTIVAATSGDTGGAAVEAFRGRKHIRTLVLFPEGRISEVQRRFMTTTGDAQVRAVAIQGSFDDCQTIVKAMFQDRALRQAVDLSGVNSINWARIAAQSVYYFTSAAALGAPGRPIAYVVPTGNFGDAFAGYVAHAMGLPIESITAATNSNDIVSRALGDGRYARGPVQHTQSPAMDIQIASNFERLYFEAADRSALETARAFRAFSESGSIGVPPKAAAAIGRLFRGQAVSEAETSRTIVSTLNETGEIIDPHTAVAVAAARRAKVRPGQAPVVILSTAHPAKFPEAVMKAAGATPDLPASCVGLGERPERFDRLPADADTVTAYLRAFAGA